MSVTSIELQVISKLLYSQSEHEIEQLCNYDTSYYNVFTEHIKFILDHREKYGNIPDIFTFLSKFPDTPIEQVNESLDYLCDEMNKHRRHIILVETFNRIKGLGADDVDICWEYLENQCELVHSLDTSEPMDIVADAHKRASQIIQFNQNARIPTGFAEIDKLMYGGLSTVEELLIIVARTNTGKSWICTKMMESAQGHGFPVLYYSPEMQASYLGTRFDTWRSHFQNNRLFLGDYNEEYMRYIKELSHETTSAYILEDKDVPEGVVSVRTIRKMVKHYGIKLLIIDGLSYMTDDRHATTDHERYKNICSDLFKLSKQMGCAVVVAMQANRETRDCKDDKGEPFPGLNNIEGSDQPARIATQVFAVRQIFDKHVLDIRLEKTRMANNQKPVLSYSWDVNTGNMQYLPDNDSGVVSQSNTIAPSVSISDVLGKGQTTNNTDITDVDLDDDVEF
jgi:replicative DNA helicase